jgi:hypothetical protein
MKIDQLAVPQPCVQFVDGYGRCDRPVNHVVHLGLNVSPVEHTFLGEATGDGTETKKLSRRNIKYIARRSGKSEEELEVMRQVAKKQGKPLLKLRYLVVAD